MEKMDVSYTREILQWACEHPSFWEVICSPTPIDKLALRDTILHLADDGLYPLILVALTVHQSEVYLQGFPLSSVLREVLQDWDRYGAVTLADRALDWLASAVM